MVVPAYFDKEAVDVILKLMGVITDKSEYVNDTPIPH